MSKHRWYVWDDKDEILCEGSHQKTLRYYKRNGGAKTGFHLGYYVKEHASIEERKI